jgi:DNA ligase D-like protein (predicted polymerase)
MATEERDGVSMTHLDEPLFDGSGATKRDLVDYLDAVSGLILPELRGRPLSVIRVRAGQQPFMQKNLPDYAPPWVGSVTLWAESSRREVRYALCDDRRALLWLGNQRAVEYHPTLSLASDLGRPTHLVLDIDPPPGGPFGHAVAAAHLIHAALSGAGLAGAVKTSGSKGVHIYVPVQASGEEAAAATRAIAARAARLDPALATTAFIIQDREGKVFLDSTRAFGATVAAAYSPRVRPGVPVSFPVRWDDLDSVAPGDFTVRSVLGLLAGHAAWAGELPAPQVLPPELVEEGRAIPVARVQAMHEGKRRKRAREAQLAQLALFAFQRSLISDQEGGGPGSSPRPSARMPSRISARYRCRSSVVRSGSANLIAATSSNDSETSCSSRSGRSTSRIRPKNSAESSLDRLARAYISGVGANLPAKARVSELVSASVRFRMKSAKTCQRSSPCLTRSIAASVSRTKVCRPPVHSVRRSSSLLP